MITHKCEVKLYYEEYYADWVNDGWPPRCDTCGRFMKWPPPVKTEEFSALFDELKETQDESHD